MPARFDHDCDACIFLGADQDHDFYHCPHDLLGGSLIARFGDDGPQYQSMPLSAVRDVLTQGWVYPATGAHATPEQIEAHPLVRALHLWEKGQLSSTSYSSSGGQMNFSNKNIRNMRATNVVPTADGGEACIYHRTAVVTRRPDGLYVLNSGGWGSNTTRVRMNQFTPPGCRVYQKDFSWYIDNQEGTPVAYFDGIVLDPRGYPVNGTGRE